MTAHERIPSAARALRRYPRLLSGGRHPPALIVDMSQADQRNASYYRPEDFPQFRRYLFGGSWREVAAVDKAGIYVPMYPAPHAGR